jgi:hypothetical protein
VTTARHRKHPQCLANADSSAEKTAFSLDCAPNMEGDVAKSFKFRLAAPRLPRFCRIYLHRFAGGVETATVRQTMVCFFSSSDLFKNEPLRPDAPARRRKISMPNWPDFQAIPELFGQSSLENGFPAQPLQRKPPFSDLLHAASGCGWGDVAAAQCNAPGSGKRECALLNNREGVSHG